MSYFSHLCIAELGNIQADTDCPRRRFWKSNHVPKSIEWSNNDTIDKKEQLRSNKTLSVFLVFCNILII